jgi:hypothetical protein
MTAQQRYAGQPGAGPGTAPPASDELARLILGQPLSAPAPAQLHIGILQACSDAQAPLQVVLEGGGRLRARVAASCLLQPQAGDLVQLLQSQQRCWILQVLERADANAPYRLDVGHAELQLHAAVLHLQADSLQETALRKQSDIQGWSSTRAAFVELRAERQLNLFGGVAMLAGEALLKVDAAQIHMG